MAKLEFDSGGIVIRPSLILMTKSEKRLGQLIGVSDEYYSRKMTSANEIAFVVHKTINNKQNPLWDSVSNFKVVWYREINECFEISVKIDEADETIKNVTGVALGESELSQLSLFGVEINTEDDIARDDYTAPTVFYNTKDKNTSLLHRVLSEAPHYTIAHVDSSLSNIQRTFSFDGTYIADALDEIAEELGCVFVYDSSIDNSSGRINRKISAYDLMNVCTVCGKRFEGSYCPECGSTSFTNGYGESTGIVIARENLADSITYEADTGAVKNCFKLTCGDDEMTDTVRACNPNGSPYIWNITAETKEDMSDELVSAIDAYDAKYKEYATTKKFIVNSTAYNNLVDKYIGSKTDLKKIYSGGASSGSGIYLTGTSSLVEAEYSVLDFSAYLETSMMPTYNYTVPTAQQQCATIRSSVTTVSVTNLNTASATTVELAVKSLAKVYAHTEIYKVEATTTSYSGNVWRGAITLTNYSDTSDTATTGAMSVTVNSSVSGYMENLVQKKVQEYQGKDFDITSLFSANLATFTAALKKYSLDCLKSFDECCQACIAVMIDQGAGASSSGAHSVYTSYRNKLSAIESEITVREKELAITGTYDNKEGLLWQLINLVNKVHDELDFENYVGVDLWNELLAYRRMQEYTNNNYVSDGLSNAEMIANAREFYAAAQAELYKSSTMQHSISANLANLLAMREFDGLTDKFDVGNWLYILIAGTPYKLRLIEFNIDFNSIQDIDVVFSDVVAIQNGMTDIKSVIDSARSISSSYNAVTHQASKGNSAKDEIKSMYKDGINATAMAIKSNATQQNMSMDDSGLLGRRWVDENDGYSPEQCRLINSMLAFTDDNWVTCRAAIGKIVVNGVEKYGIIAENIVGESIDSNLINVDDLLAKNVTATGLFQVKNNLYELVANEEQEVVMINYLGDDEMGAASFACGMGACLIQGNQAVQLSSRKEVSLLSDNLILLDATTVMVFGDFSVTGTKNRIVPTTDYDNRLLYCYETASPYFGDIGEGRTDDTGECVVELDDIFSETISDMSYQVFLQAEGPGTLYVESKSKRYFVVKGDPGLNFSWEIKAKQSGYELDRLETHEESDTNLIDYEGLYEREISRLLEEQEALLDETA